MEECFGAMAYLKLLRYDLSCMTLVLKMPNGVFDRPFGLTVQETDEVWTKLKFPDAHRVKGKARPTGKKRQQKTDWAGV